MERFWVVINMNTGNLCGDKGHKYFLTSGQANILHNRLGCANVPTSVECVNAEELDAILGMYR